MTNKLLFILFTLSLSLKAADTETGSLKWNGDLRYRHEWIQSEGSSPASYNQHRLMFRVGAKTAIDSTADVDFRIATGTGRTSLNQTLNSGFSNYSIGLDRAFFSWRPIENLSILGGRVKNTFYCPKNSDLVWDTDLNFDGLSFNYVVDSEFKPFLTGTFYWLNKVTSADSMDNHLVALQTGMSTKFTSTSLAFGVAFYQYTNMTKQNAIDTSNFKGNSSSGTGATATYASNFNVINPNIEVEVSAAGVPLTFSGDFVVNPAASTEKTGFLAGIAVGESKKKGDWKFSYDYRQLRADSTVAAFTDADSFSGGTDGKGHRVKVGYRLMDPLLLSATAYIGSKNISEGSTSVDRHKAHLDLTWTF